ncbi:MAG TPA: NAD-dependent epimerase/dehydratase family protein [Tepidisphaeraceae bacterium]
MRVLVTGGAGFIGSHICDALVQLGAKVIVLDDLSGGDTANLPHEVEFIRASILDLPALDRATDGCKFVFHQAALGSVPRSIEQPRLYHDVDTTGTFNVLESARQAGVQRVMFAASSSVYGDAAPDQAKLETMPMLPRSPYAAAKAAGEALLGAFARSLNIDTVSLRYFNIFGPKQNANSAYAAVIAAFAKAMQAEDAPNIYGDGSQSRDFTFVANAVHANLLAAACSNALDGEAINVATGHSVTVNELAMKMGTLYGSTKHPQYAPVRAGDVLHSLADISKAKQLLGYQPLVNFDEGLRQTVEWYRKQN